MNNFRLALRQLRKNPGFAVVAIVTLALGIGANTAIFSMVNAVLLRPLPYPDAGRIMVLNESSGPGEDYSVALPDYFDWRNDNTVFEQLAATHKESRNLSGIPGRDPERVSCASVTRNFFDIVGLRLVIACGGARSMPTRICLVARSLCTIRVTRSSA